MATRRSTSFETTITLKEDLIPVPYSVRRRTLLSYIFDKLLSIFTDTAHNHISTFPRCEIGLQLRIITARCGRQGAHVYFHFRRDRTTSDVLLLCQNDSETCWFTALDFRFRFVLGEFGFTFPCTIYHNFCQTLRGSSYYCTSYTLEPRFMGCWRQLAHTNRPLPHDTDDTRGNSFSCCLSLTQLPFNRSEVIGKHPLPR